MQTILITIGIIYPMAALSLAAMRKGARGVVTGVADDGQSLGDSSRSTVSRRLLELGFCPGPDFFDYLDALAGADPIAVRVGNSVFALRRREAAAVMVDVEDSGSK